MNNTLPKYTIKEMLEAGVHFGHKEMLWNPKMDPFIYGSRNGVHIINLQKTVSLLYKALNVFKAAGSNKKNKILFVGTKRQASESVRSSAIACGQYYVDQRWLGGMLTNWKTISKSIKKLDEMEKILEAEKNPETSGKYNKKELLDIDRKRQKIEASLGGIRNMGGKPDLIFIIDTNKEKIAIQEAKMLGIPVVAVVDTNSSLEDIDFPIPGNDDASRAIKFYCEIVSKAINVGAEATRMDIEEKGMAGSLSESMKSGGEVKGESKKPQEEKSVLKVKSERDEKTVEKKKVASEKKESPKKSKARKKVADEKKETLKKATTASAKDKEVEEKKKTLKKATVASAKDVVKAKKVEEKKKTTAKKEK
jgi:small subunit ribosomal protein S2